MSERKTSEIKFRCTPSFKAAVQAQAEAEGISASQLIENAVQSHIWAEANKKLDGTALVGNAIALLEPVPAEELLDADDIAVIVAESWADEDGGESGLVKFISTNISEAGKLDEDALKKAHASVVGCNCRPWEYCTHKTNA